jgi:hypothetical protein
LRREIRSNNRDHDETATRDHSQSGGAAWNFGEGEGEMVANVLPSIFTIEIGDTPTLVFEAQTFREARELCHEQWLKGDLAEAKRDGVPLWDGKAKLRARPALPRESSLFPEAKNNGEPSDGEATDDEPVGPGEFPPQRT